MKEKVLENVIKGTIKKFNKILLSLISFFFYFIFFLTLRYVHLNYHITFIHNHEDMYVCRLNVFGCVCVFILLNNMLYIEMTKAFYAVIL